MLNAFKKQGNLFQEADSDLSETWPDHHQTIQLLYQASEALSGRSGMGSGGSETNIVLSEDGKGFLEIEQSITWHSYW